MKKQVLDRVWAICLAFTLMLATAFAAEAETKHSTCNQCGKSYNNGICTDCNRYQAPELAGGVYQIANAGQLYWFAALVNDGVDGMEKNVKANAVLTADIVVNTGDVAKCGGIKQNGWIDWTPIAYGNSRKYSGTFDGQGHTVSGLYCKNTRMNNVGLFGDVQDGIVCNVGVVNSYIHGGNYVGGVCGRIYNTAGGTVRTISGCYHTGTVKCETYSAGGVFGYVQNDGGNAVITVTNCYNSGDVYLTGERTSGNAGGVCGYINNTGASAAVTLTKCYNTGSVQAAGSSSKRLGGVCGRCDKATISNCYNIGNVTANGTKSTDVGGVCGHLYTIGSAAAQIIDCYNYGTPSTPKNRRSNLGGICGFASAANITVTNCYFRDKTAAKGIGNGNGTSAVKTKEAFASGEVAYLLNGRRTMGTDAQPLIWYQNIDMGTPDGYPKFSGGTVYTAAEESHQAYTNYNGDHRLEHISEKAATVTETGNIEYWHCLDCGRYYADNNGENEIQLEDTVRQKLPPDIIGGKGQSVTEGERKALSFKSNAAFRDFIRVELDGKTLDERNYTAEEGSIIVTLKADCIAALSVGEHTIGIVSDSGTASTTFTVNAIAAVDDDTHPNIDTATLPQTGDNSHMALWIALLLVSGGLMTVIGVYSKKKKAE